jgi:ABC-type nitrate/sulfonate/bicarbonate transport system substrate-binding protein
VRPGSETIDPIKSVLARTDDVGVASADLVALAIAQGAPLVAIGVVNDISPTCFLTRFESGITTPAQFVHHKVGVLAGTNTERIYKLMMKRNNVDRKQIDEIDAPQDVKSFMLGSYDVRPAFIYDEPVTLKNAGIKFNIIKPSDYGVNYLGTVYFTRTEVVAAQRKTMIDLLASLVQGWRAVSTAAGQADAINLLKQSFPEVDADREKTSLELGAPLFEGPSGSGRPLTATPSHWQDTLSGLVDLGDLKPNALNLSQIWNSSLLDAAYTQVGS